MVAMNVWPTDAADGSVANEARWRKMARQWQPSGVIAGMVPSLAYPNLTITAGACWVDGHYCELPGSQVLAATANGLAVVRFDPAANTAELLYRDGATTPNQNPAGVYEIPLAVISGSAYTVDARAIIDPAGGMLFGTTVARDLNLPNPPNGLILQSPPGVILNRVNGAWQSLTPPKAIIGYGTGGNVPPGTAVTSASIAMLQPGLYYFSYSVLVACGGPFKGNVNFYGPLGQFFSTAHNCAAGGAQTWGGHTYVQYDSPSALNVQIQNTGPTGIDSYSDSTNHRILAIPISW